MTGLRAPRWSCRVAAVLAACVAASGGQADDAVGHGRVRVAIKSVPPFVMLGPSGPTGFSIDLWSMIAEKVGCDTQFVETASIGDQLEAVRSGQAEVGIGAITITAQREADFDFSHPFYRTGLRIAVSRKGGVTWLGTLARFWSLDFLLVLGSLAGLTLATAHLLWFLEHPGNPAGFPRSYLRGVWEALWWSIATIITGGCENKAPESVPGRLVAIAWMLGSIVLVASFTATLSSQMTAETVTGGIAGPDQLSGRLVATVSDTAAAEDLRARLARVLECESLAAAIDAAASGRAEAVVFDAPVLAHALQESPSSQVRLVGPLFERQDYGIIEPPGSPLRKQINQALLALSESGALSELHLKWFGERE